MSTEMTAATDQAPLSAAAAATGAAAIINMIQIAATNPTADIDKMERLMQMYERQRAWDAHVQYTAALSRMQRDLPEIKERGAIKNREGKVQSQYALWEDINDAIRPHLSANGFSLSFRTGRSDDGRPTVTGILAHDGGHREETTITLPIDDSGSKNSVQGLGSSTSYGKRYTAQALLNLTSRGEDDDGAAAGTNPEHEKWFAKIALCSSLPELAEVNHDLKAAYKDSTVPKPCIAAWQHRTKQLKSELAEIGGADGTAV